MCIKIFISKTRPIRLWAELGECGNSKASLRNGTLGRSWPCCLEVEFLLPPGNLRFCSSGLWLTGLGHHSVEGDLLYFSSDVGCEPHPQNTFMATSRWVFGWITGDWPAQPDTDSWPSQYLSSFFSWKNPNICPMIGAFCNSLGFALK